MIKILLNDQTTQLEDECSLADALKIWGYLTTSFAVAVNRIFVSRVQYAQIQLKNNDVVEIVAPMQGG